MRYGGGGADAGQEGHADGGPHGRVTRLAADPSAWAALATLIAMEVVLGVDNLVFIALLSNRVDERRRAFARGLGLSLALVFRLALLASRRRSCG